MTAAQIIVEAKRLGLDPVEFAEDLADGYGWDEDMTADAVESVKALLRSTAEGLHSVADMPGEDSYGVTVGLDDYQHVAGECYTRKIADHWEDNTPCGDPRCLEARALWIEREVNRTQLAVYQVAPNDPKDVWDRASAILNGAGPETRNYQENLIACPAGGEVAITNASTGTILAYITSLDDAKARIKQFQGYITRFDYSEADIEPMPFNSWLQAKMNQEAQGRLHALHTPND